MMRRWYRAELDQLESEEQRQDALNYAGLHIPRLWYLLVAVGAGLPIALSSWDMIKSTAMLFLTQFALLYSLAVLLVRPTRRQLRIYLNMHDIPVCLECGYSLRGLTETRCPECGCPFSHP